MKDSRAYIKRRGGKLVIVDAECRNGGARIVVSGDFFVFPGDALERFEECVTKALSENRNPKSCIPPDAVIVGATWDDILELISQVSIDC